MKHIPTDLSPREAHDALERLAYTFRAALILTGMDRERAHGTAVLAARNACQRARERPPVERPALRLVGAV